MPFCTQCGHEVGNADVFCANCGKRQSPTAPGPSAAPPPPPPFPGPPGDPLASITPRTASILCYIPTVGWIAAVVVLASKKFKTDRIVRFHAFQGLYLFAAWLLVQWVVRPVMHAVPGHPFPLDSVLSVILFLVSIFMVIKASHNEVYVLPIIGELAQKSALEQ
ncbi:MAG: hypothetical protein KGN84_10560 [Acidobacteriota bacterium]|nr:hypothetical protein [Acidobacteriota bacterium]